MNFGPFISVLRITSEQKSTYDLLNRTVDNFLSRSAYFVVSFPKIYQQYDIVDESENQKTSIKKINWSQVMGQIK